MQTGLSGRRLIYLGHILQRVPVQSESPAFNVIEVRQLICIVAKVNVKCSERISACLRFLFPFLPPKNPLDGCHCTGMGCCCCCSQNKLERGENSFPAS